MPSNDQRSYHHGDLRSALIAAAIEEVRERGVPALSLRSVAKRAGVSEAAPYHHFDGKAGLLGAAAAVAFEAFAETLQAAADRDGSALALSVPAAYVEYGLDHRGEYQLMFGEHIVALGVHQQPEAQAAGGRAALIALEAFDQSLRQRGISVPLDTAFSTSWALLHGVVTLVTDREISGLRREQAVQMAVDGVDALLRGWSTAKPPT